MLAVYPVYCYKPNKKLKLVRSMAANTDREQNRVFCKVAIAMGATIAISSFPLGTVS